MFCVFIANFVITGQEWAEVNEVTWLAAKLMWINFIITRIPNFSRTFLQFKNLDFKHCSFASPQKYLTLKPPPSRIHVRNECPFKTRSRASTWLGISRTPATVPASSRRESGWGCLLLCSWFSSSPMACTWLCSCAPWTALTILKALAFQCLRTSNSQLKYAFRFYFYCVCPDLD